MNRRLPIGAEPALGGAHVRVWAPRRARVDVVVDDRRVPLDRETAGYFSGLVAGAGPGTRYRLSLDGGTPLPDPASRFQPDGPHGPSEIVDPDRYRWRDDGWRGVPERGHVLYELHVGTFTPQGTFASAAAQLPELARLGITAIELMPVAEFPGRFGWGYDGVDMFAPYHGYGTPDDLRAFVDDAHALGLGVILDVIYNHFGPDGNYLREFSDSWFSDAGTEWGDAINYDGPGCQGVREFVIANARHWIGEYHFDGLRLDAAHAIVDRSTPHILAELGDAARQAAGNRGIVLIAESEPQDPRHVRPVADGGHGLTHIWCDDFHHTAQVACTGRREAYFTDYRGSAQEFVSVLRRNVLYQGQYYRWQRKRRGRPMTGVAPHRCVIYLENHDQVANSRHGLRLHALTSPARYRALAAVLLLAPQTPMLFQGQEFGASAPFLYFADHNPALSALVRTGRARFMSQFASLAAPEDLKTLPDPAAESTFTASRLDPAERDANGAHHRLYRDLIARRRSDPVFANGEYELDGAILGDHAFVLRYFAANGVDDRLLIVNLGDDLVLDVAPEPLLAPPREDADWRRVWHSEDPAYGGAGAGPLQGDDGEWRIPAQSATLLVCAP